MENDKNALDSIEDNKLHIAATTEHVMDDVKSMASTDACSKQETLGVSTVVIAERLSIESNEGERDGHDHFSMNDKVIQGHDMEGSTVQAFSAMEASKAPCVEGKGSALIEPRHVQNTTVANTSSMEKTLVTPSVIGTDNLSIESIPCEKDDHQQYDLAADKKALQGHGLDDSRIVYEVTEDEGLSHIATTEEDALQEHGIERNTVACGVMGDDGSGNFTFKDTCKDTRTLVEQSQLILNDKKKEVEENDYQHSCFVPPSGNQDDKQTCYDLPCCEAISNQEKMSSIRIDTELLDNFDGFLSNDELIESHNPDCEMAGLVEDKEHKAGAKNALSKVSEKVQWHCQRSNITDTLSHDESYEQENLRLENENSEAGDSCSLAEAVQDEDAKQDLLAVSENTNSCLKVSENDAGSNASLSQDDEECASDSCMSYKFLSVEDKAVGIPQVTESGDLVSRQDICDDNSKQESMELQITAIDVKSDDDSTSGSLKYLTCALDTLKISNLAHKECAGDEECLLTAGQDPSMKCLSSCPLITSSVEQVRDIDDNNTHFQCNEGNKLVGLDFGIGQTEEGTASNESQLHLYMVDKDGGSSMDSTAGTEWKLLGADGCIAAEDEEASNTGGEDSASSPACLQPSSQQRKKININHQFVREIVSVYSPEG